jgi:hypothetical protein
VLWLVLGPVTLATITVSRGKYKDTGERRAKERRAKERRAKSM